MGRAVKYICFLILLGNGISGQQYADAFLNIGTYPRSIGLGRAVSALPQNPSGYLLNPAATGFIETADLSLMYVNQFGLADFTAINFAAPWRQRWQVGVNLLALSIDGIPERPDLRRIIDLETRRDSIRALVAQGFDTFNDRETGLVFNVSRNFARTVDLGWMISPFHVTMPVGLNVKILHKRLHELVGWGIGVDLGTVVSFALSDLVGLNWIGDLSLGLTAADLVGSLIYWNSGKYDQIAMCGILGLGYTHQFKSWPVRANILYQKRTTDDTGSMGLEVVLLEKYALRAGSDRGILNGGVGVQIPYRNREFAVDYSFLAHDLGNAHRIGFRLPF